MAEETNIGQATQPRIQLSALELAQRLGRDAIGAAATTTLSLAAKRDEFDLVTSVDRAIERHLREQIEATFPDQSILGEEEGGLEAGPSGWTWILDPIDGTFNFATGLGPSGCSIALAHGTEVEVGVIADFSAGVVYSARRGGGGVLADGAPVETRGRPGIAASRFFLEFGAERLDRELVDVLAAFTEAIPVVPRLLGSAVAALVATALAGGVFAGVGLRIWDVAAGVLLAAESGQSVRWWPGSDDAVHVLVGEPERVELLAPVMGDAVEVWQSRGASRD